MNSFNIDSDEIKPNYPRGGGGIAMEQTKPAKTLTNKAKTFLRVAMAALLMCTAVLLGTAQNVQAATGDAPKVLVLDAGHGGHDPGAVDPVDGYTEAALVEEMADRIEGLFSAHGDEVNIVRTKGNGTFASINERAAVTGAVDADLFVSLHLNAAENRAASGFQVFPTPPGRTHHAGSVKMAEDMVAHVREIGRPIMGTNGVYYAFYRGNTKDFYDAANYNEVNARSSFGVLENASCPAVLVEQWFITNQGDMQMFNNDFGMDLMARQLYRGLCDTMGISYQH